jgi:glycine cleavage system H protein
MSNIPEDLKYYKEHEWVKKNDDGSVLIGITDYAQNNLTDITYVGFNKTEKGSTVEFGKVFGEIESVKSVSDLFSPISGEVLEVNEALEDEPELVNNDPYGKGWMLKIKPSNLEGELSQLMDASAYKSFIESL